jgi:hypothetical protein
MTRLNFSTLKLTMPKLLGTAAILATALASPAMAQQVIYNPGRCAQYYPDANCQNEGPGNPYTGNYQRRADGYQQGWNNDWNSGGWRQSRNDDPITWSSDVAAAAVGTAGAIATAPFRAADAYAYDTGSYDDRPIGAGYAHSDYYANAHAGQGWNRSFGNQNSSYAARNGFVCEPGSFFRGEDGLRHRCQ